MAMTHDDVQQWLDAYVAAWRAYDPAKIGALFTEDAAYLESPMGDPVVGRDNIVERWVKYQDTDLNSNPWTAVYSPWIVEGDRAIAIGETKYHRKAFHNCFQITFRDGQASEFVEWFMELNQESAESESD